MSLFRDLLIEKKRKPYYCEVEYLETTGQQTNSTDTANASWIDTGIAPDDTTQMECRVSFTTLVSGSNTEALFGATGASTGNYRFASISPYTNFYIGLGGQNLTTSLTRDTNVHTFKIDAINKTWAIDNTSGPFTSSGSLSDTYSIFLFARHNPAYGDNKANKPANARTYYCKIWKGGSLVRDMIPVLDWNYTPCMYDKISGRLFYNQGTGTFTYGREIHYVEYLESTGTQYIDTGIKLTNNYSVELDYQLTQASQSRAGLFGALNMTGSNQGRLGSILSPSNQQLEHGYGSGNDYWQQGLPDTNRHKLYQKKNEIYFDGNLIHTFNTATFSLAINAYLGNFVYTNYTPAKAKYYSSRWWDGTTLVRDYKPAIDENGVCFWFDRVTHVIYENAGTDAFGYPARETEYLQSTGTQYIDTGVIGDTTKGVELEAYMTGGTNNSCGVGSWGDDGLRDWIFYMFGNQFRTGFGLTNSTIGVDVELNRWYKYKAITVNNIQQQYIDNELVYTSSEQNFNTNRNLYLFGMNNKGTFNYGFRGRMKCVKLYDNDTPIRDFIPVYKDGVACMVDKLTGTAYLNQGTGTFTTGKIVESRWF